jgi:hypothetical protein
MQNFSVEKRRLFTHFLCRLPVLSFLFFSKIALLYFCFVDKVLNNLLNKILSLFRFLKYNQMFCRRHIFRSMPIFLLFTSKLLLLCRQKTEQVFKLRKFYHKIVIFLLFNIHVGSLSSAEFPVWKLGREYSDRDHVIFFYSRERLFQCHGSK